jgi:ABC-type sugar transport system permease subunit
VKKSLNYAPWVFLAPFLGIFAVFTVWPLIHSLFLAMQQTYGPGRVEWVGLHNFKFLLTDPLFWKATANTIKFALGSLFIQLPVALGLALLLNRPSLKGRAIFRLIFFAPSLVGLPFVAMLFAPIFEQRTGLLNVTLHKFISGWDPNFAWTQNYIMTALIIAALWMYAGFNMVYFLAALQNVSKDLIEAAEIDGASPWQRFLHVTVPGILPIAGFVTLLSVIGSFQLFELSYIMLGDTAGPDNGGLTIVMYLYQTGFQTGDLGYASTIGWVLALMLISIAMIQRRILKRHEEN